MESLDSDHEDKKDQDDREEKKENVKNNEESSDEESSDEESSAEESQEEEERPQKTEEVKEEAKQEDKDKGPFRVFDFWTPNKVDPDPKKKRKDDSEFCDNSIRTTKYTIITFLPLNLFEQFRRLANFYFLCIAMIQLIPGLTNIDPSASIAPLIFVLAVTAIKEAYEDWRRYQSDYELNHRTCLCMRDRLESELPNMKASQMDIEMAMKKDADVTFEEVLWQDLRVGDIIKLGPDQWVPCDIVLLNSSLEEGMCYVQTANLDGETNLKVRQALKETTNLNTPREILKWNGKIECELPNKDLYNFDGAMWSVDNPNKKFSLSNKQVLLRGCKLKNTEWIYGVVIFTGHETKLMKNSRAPPAKRSSVEKLMNFALITIFAFMFSLVLICAGLSIYYMSHKEWYLHWGSEPNDPAYYFFWNLGSFLILYSYMIPISLYVSLEIVKLCQTYLLNQDLRMYDEASDTPAKAKTSNLNEELGQIEYIFSDKTGTLTCNIMELVKSSINAHPYNLVHTGEEIRDVAEPETPAVTIVGKDILLDRIKKSEEAEQLREFFILLAVCHTVLPEFDSETQNIKYQASSPDEFALVSKAAELGFVLKRRTLTSVFVEIDGKEQEYQILNVNEFNNVRKRMSVVCRTPDGKIKLYCKGADVTILARISKQQTILQETTQHLQMFAAEGLRTLCCSVLDISEKRYEEWNQKFHNASIAIADRAAKMEAVAEEIEQEMILLGATAIEDKLQDGVPETIAALRKSGFKIWVLTGDKRETAINIGFSCQLLTADVTPIIVEGVTFEVVEMEIGKAITDYLSVPALVEHKDTKTEFGLVVEGAALAFALGGEAKDSNKEEIPLERREKLKQQFLQLALACKTVICCRVTPSQKKDVVKLVRSSIPVRTLSIGDGANDVAMIQEAHVGIGIIGKEGVQAAMASDYAIAQFKFLRILLQIHGRWSYNRISKLVLYCFYKNMVLGLSQFFFNIYAMFSAQNLFDSWILIVYNVVFTAFPILVFAIFDQDVRADNALRFPGLYEYGPKNKSFNLPLLWLWLVEGMCQSCIIFYFSYLIFGLDIITESDQGSGIWGLGVMVYTLVIITVNLKIALETNLWTWVNHLFTWGSIIVWFFYVLAYSAIFGLSPNAMYLVAHHIFRAPGFWLGIVIIPVICLIPDYIFKYVWRNYFPENYHIVQEIARSERKERKKSTVSHKRRPNFRAVVNMTQALLKIQPAQKADSDIPYSIPHTGFAFAQEEGQAEAMRITTIRKKDGKKSKKDKKDRKEKRERKSKKGKKSKRQHRDHHPEEQPDKELSIELS